MKLKRKVLTSLEKIYGFNGTRIAARTAGKALKQPHHPVSLKLCLPDLGLPLNGIKLVLKALQIYFRLPRVPRLGFKFSQFRRLPT